MKPLRNSQPAVRGGPPLDPDLARWLASAGVAIGLALPPNEVRTFSLTSAQVTANFTATGLGLTAGPYDGWAVCNGSNGTPDLRDRFIRIKTTGAGATGGNDSSAHTHAVDPASVTSGAPSDTKVVAAGAGETVASSTHTHAVDVASTTSGAASASENRPAYYELVALMRVRNV